MKPERIIVAGLLLAATGCGQAALPHIQAHGYPRPRPSPAGPVVRGYATISGLGGQALGDASLTLLTARRQLTVQVTVAGLERLRRYPTAIRIGPCARPGPTVYGLRPLAVGINAKAVTTTVLSGVSGIPAKGWVLAVEEPVGGRSLACGAIYRSIESFRQN